MDFSTVNRGAFALLLTAAAASTFWFAGSLVVPYAPPARPALAIPSDAPPPPAESAAPDATPAPATDNNAIASDAPTPAVAGDTAHGAALAQQSCAMCHTLAKDAPDTVGPALFGVLNRKIGGKPGYTYSPALASHGGTWDMAALDRWLQNPAAFAPGTRMSFPGLPQASDRADLIAWLKTLN